MTSRQLPQSAVAEDSVLRPFRGLRYDPRHVDLVTATSQPLEATDTAGVAAALDGNQYNVGWLIDPLLARSDAPHDAATVTKRLAEWRRTGVVRHDPVPAIYVYRQRRPGGQTLVGLIAALSLDDAPERRLLAHEEVNPAVLARHVALLEATAAQPEPVVLVHPGSSRLRDLLRTRSADKPTMTIIDGLAEHSVWRVADAAAVAAAADLVDAPLLIADGHHRYAAFQRYRGARGSSPRQAPWTYGLVMIVDATDCGLVLGAFHRVVPTLDWARVRVTPGLQLQALPDEPAAMAYLRDGAAAPTRCVISDGTTWMAVEPLPAPAVADLAANADPLASLAVAHLHHDWLPRWGVAERDLDYRSDSSLAVAAARRSGGLAVLLPAPPLDVVFAAARQHRLLPPKSTAFRPRPRLGMVMRHWPEGLDDLKPEARSPVRADAAGAAPG